MSKLPIRGFVDLLVRRGGKVVHREKGENVITILGLNLAAANFEADSGTRITHAALGSGSTPATINDTALDTETASTRVAKTSDTVAGNEVQFKFDWTATAAWVMNELGLFTASSGGDLIARFLTVEFNFQIGDEFELTWTIAFGAAS